jgi:hypothetical protein
VPFDTPDILKLLAGLLFLVAGAWQYRRRSGGENGGYGSQSGVLLLGVGALLIAWVVGGLFAQPTAAELGR